MLPEFYQTLWFRLAAITLLVAAFAFLLWLRVRQVNRRQETLKHLNTELDQRVRERTAELSRSNEELRQRELEQEKLHQRLLDVSRQAGMAEVATDVLHNVGNVLNSVSVSASLVVGNVKKSRISSLAKVVALLREHERDLWAFLTSDSRGKQLPAYLAQLSEYLQAEQETTVRELDSLRGNIEHIEQIVTMQQSYARVAGVVETVTAAQLVDDAVHINAAALVRHNVQVRRDFGDAPPIQTEKHKVLQILVNLIRNAKYAIDETKRSDGLLTLRIGNDGDSHVKIEVIDNGVGIPTENLTRIFSHGFTTRRNGHGFGLHSSALAVRELGGSLVAHSEGPGTGATFTLLLPHQPPPRPI
jgi:signal transduction histidine kinase